MSEPNNGAVKYTKQKLIVLREENDISKITAGDFSTTLSVISRVSREKIIKDEKDANSSKNNFT